MSEANSCLLNCMLGVMLGMFVILLCLFLYN